MENYRIYIGRVVFKGYIKNDMEILKEYNYLGI